jgi:hypothetical protein
MVTFVRAKSRASLVINPSRAAKPRVPDSRRGDISVAQPSDNPRCVPTLAHALALFVMVSFLPVGRGRTGCYGHTLPVGAG